MNNLAIAQAAYRLEQRILDSEQNMNIANRRSRLWASLTEVLRCHLTAWGGWEQERLCALLVFTKTEQGVMIERLLVDPSESLMTWGQRLLSRLLHTEPDVAVDLELQDVGLVTLYRMAGFETKPERQSSGEHRMQRFCYQRPSALMEPPKMSLDERGWVNEAKKIVSPNCDERPEGERISLLVVHAISLPPCHYGGKGVEQLFTNTLDPEDDPYYVNICHLRVSAHFFVRRDGALLQFVSTRQRAWHAGLSCWHGREQCNDFSIGVELEGCDYEPYREEQYLTLIELVHLLKKHFPLTALAGHEHIAPLRKTDPGPWFEWERVHQAVGLPIG